LAHCAKQSGHYPMLLHFLLLASWIRKCGQR